MRITWAMKSASDQGKARSNQERGYRPRGRHGSSGGPGVARAVDLVPQIGGTCLTCDGNGHQPRTDADRIGKAIRLGLTSIMFYYRDLSLGVCKWLGAEMIFC
jgi:hypothetical protein